MKLRWLSNYSFVLEVSGKTILVDPVGEYDYPVADIIIVTQFHFAHCDFGIIRKCTNDNTRVFSTSEVASLLYPCSVLNVGDSKVVGDVEIFCTPVKNDRPPLRPGQGPNVRIGFVLHVEKKKYFFIGDSDFVEGMQEINPDVLFIPVGGTLVPDAREAADIAKIIEPKLAVPVHWSGLVGSRDDADFFCDLVKYCRIINPGEVVKL